MNNNKFTKFKIQNDKSLIQSLRQLKKYHLDTLLVTNKIQQIIGVLSLSDIRNSIIRGIKLNEKISNIINKNFIYVDFPFNNEKKVNLISNKLYQKRNPNIVPLLDQQKKLKDVLISSDMILLGNRLSNYKNTITKKNVLIIGGAGYIGSELTESLIKEKFNITIYDNFLYGSKSLDKFKKNKRINIIKGDTRDIHKLYIAIKESNIVIHLGEYVGDPLCTKYPDHTYSVNFLATKNICNLCKDLGINNFLYVSSCSVYGYNQKKILSENDTLNPMSTYAKLKIDCERAVLESSTKDFKPCILRLGTVFGSSNRQRFDLSINFMAINAIKKNKVHVNGGNQWRPFVHVKDVANTIKKIINLNFNRCRGEIFNLSTFNSRIIDVALIIKKILPKVKLKIIKKKIDNRNYKVTSYKISKLRIFKPKFNLKNGILEILSEIKKIKKINIHSKRFNNYLL